MSIEDTALKDLVKNSTRFVRTVGVQFNAIGSGNGPIAKGV
jgi:hypothetical protein